MGAPSRLAPPPRPATDGNGRPRHSQGSPARTGAAPEAEPKSCPRGPSSDLHASASPFLVVAVTLAQLVGVERRAAAARERADARALLAADKAADQSAAARAHRDRQLVAVLLPEGAAPGLTVVVIDAARSAVAVDGARAGRGAGHDASRRRSRGRGRQVRLTSGV